MDLVRVSKGLARLSFKRANVLCAVLAFPVVLVLIVVSSSVDTNSNTSQYAHTSMRRKAGVTTATDLLFGIARQQRAGYQVVDTRGDTQSDRVMRINRLCKKMDVPGTVKGLYVFNNVSYCYNYKVASTYWIQVYRFLYDDVSYNVTKPSDISKYEAHLVKTKKIRLHYLFSLTDHDAIRSSFRFMMTRDPYARLWSVYVDKFVLLDHYFWSHYSPVMKRFFLRYNATLDDVDTTKKPKFRCAEISFTEFLNYVGKKGEMYPENLDDHMRPIHYGCNPCFYSPQYVGKVENMIREKTPIIEKLGLNVSDDISDFKSHVINEISMISDFEFKLWKRFKKSYVHCVTDVSLEKKMIQTFIINGYLPEQVWKTFHGLLPLGEQRFKAEVIDVFLKSLRNSSVVKEQRVRIRRDAYREVPIAILNKIRRLYKYDFALFGYNPLPHYIFGDR